MRSGLSPQDKKRINLLIVVIALAVSAWLLLSPYGLKKVIKTHRDLKQVSAVNQSLREKNAAMKEEIEKLKSDQKYLEEVARKRHGMVKKNEMIFEFKDNQK